jgi:hypothetical protein
MTILIQLLEIRYCPEMSRDCHSADAEWRGLHGVGGYVLFFKWAGCL